MLRCIHDLIIRDPYMPQALSYNFVCLLAHHQTEVATIHLLHIFDPRLSSFQFQHLDHPSYIVKKMV